MPAPAGWNVGRDVGSIAASIPKLVTPPCRFSPRKTADSGPLCHSSIVRPVSGFHVEETGSGPRLVLVHGSVGTGAITWNAQRALAGRFTLVVVDRPGYPPNPPLERIDFAVQAAALRELLEPGDHLVGHSYGGVISLLAADERL